MIAHLRVAAVAVAMLSPAATMAQPTVSRTADSLRAELEVAVHALAIPRVAAVRSTLERAAAQSPSDAWVHHLAGYAAWREASLRGSNGPEARLLLDAARRHLERSASLRPIPETHALLAGVLGQSIGGNPLRAMTLGSRSNKEMDRALELGPDNPRVWLMRGMGAFHAPAVFGGGADRAERYLLKAVELYERDRPVPSASSWGRAEAYAWLGQLYAREKRGSDARRMYDLALREAPNYRWVKDVLLPALERGAD
jgi:tetratricopeptide (TPR) repeat protein